MRLLDIPIIDFAPFRTGDPDDRDAVAKQIDHACRDIGFLVIRGHGIDPALVGRMREALRQFFDLPLEESWKSLAQHPMSRVGISALPVNRSVDRGILPRPRVTSTKAMVIRPVDEPDPEYAGAPEAGNHFAPNLFPHPPRGVQGCVDRLLHRHVETCRRLDEVVRVGAWPG